MTYNQRCSGANKSTSMIGTIIHGFIVVIRTFFHSFLGLSVAFLFHTQIFLQEVPSNAKQAQIIKDVPDGFQHLNRVNMILEEVLSLSGHLSNFHGERDGNVRKNIQDMTNLARLEINAFTFESSFEEYKATEIKKLSFIIQNRIKSLQFPTSEENCKKANKLYCEIRNEHGFASAFHDIVWCFTAGYYRRKMVLLDTSNWKYLKDETWEQVFMPLGNLSGCQSWKKQEKTQEKKIYPGKNDAVARGLLHFLPKEIGKRLTAIHADPLAWWIGQLAVYIFRPQPRLSNFFAVIRKKLELIGNYVASMHVRRTDKIGLEASNHTVDEYMIHVEHYYRRQALQVPKEGESEKKRRQIYLATDDPFVIRECKKKYNHYIFISILDGAELAEFQQTRYSNSSLWNLLADLYFLSEAAYFVGTFSSGFSRLAYELLQGKKDDGTLSARSLDVPFHYDFVRNPARVAIYTHQSSDRKREWNLNIGDVLYSPKDGTDLRNQAKRGRHYDSFFFGTKRQRNVIKMYPWYKTASKIPFL